MKKCNSCGNVFEDNKLTARFSDWPPGCPSCYGTDFTDPDTLEMMDWHIEQIQKLTKDIRAMSERVKGWVF